MLLVHGGVNVNTPDVDGRTVLKFAVDKNHRAITGGWKGLGKGRRREDSTAG